MRSVIILTSEQKELLDRAASLDGVALGPWIRQAALFKARNMSMADPAKAAALALHREKKDARRDAKEAALAIENVGRDARRAKRDRRRELGGLEAAAWDAVRVSVLARTEGTGTQAQVLAATVAAKALTEEREALGK